ncbi:hypothetical protein CHLNCDRAFT_58054 [Chlorella variabilis]|uniref:Amine oxidase n=1 Tax=Chlorella variabilis TaxID=554065 RepID=E1ZGM2_CHLVA|nr:hypothetical protein CHLNCDRAFT_58054 [Chlorella variabilis]EFN54781.1 hypothetical protein CHLNCDRAFT_58054 [Chlorella variabilis]|eukprot:XP_005846883.1 hypothetical protein CHLNCDRAFT_58054 [Chlorella variabilis]
MTTQLQHQSDVARRAGTLAGKAQAGVTLGDLHPLDPIRAEEILAAAQACREYGAQLGIPKLRFNSMAAQEPEKGAVLAYLRGDGPRPARRALAVLEVTAEPYAVIEAVVDLEGAQGEVLSWKEMVGVQPCLTIDDVVESEERLKANPEFLALMASRYGITDMQLLAVDPWYSGFRYGSPEGRILQFLLYMRSSPDDNHYAHPLDTIIFYDYHADRIHKVYSQNGEAGWDVPAQDANFHRTLVDRPWRTTQKPLNIVQPEGPSFAVRGNLVSWEGWDFHVGFSWREGLILNNLSLAGRPVLYRAALAEIIVPYGEPREPFQYKAAYDIVDYGLGFCANPLELGCDCLGHIKYFDAVLNNSRGGVTVIKKAVCMHEEDVGMAWKHYEYRNGHVEVRRHRRLVISFIATIANYEYGFYWYLYQDGTIGFEGKLTGIVSTHALFPAEVANGGQPQWGTRLAPGVNAHIHQHFFMVRLDPAVDCPEGGKNLQVVEVEAEPMPLGPANPHGVGFDIVERVLGREAEAQRMCAPERSRVWKVQNPNSINPVTGKPVAWKLMPGSPCPPMLAHPTSSHATRGVFATKHLWVTPYHPKEMNPAGDYPLHPDPEQNQGIGQWTRANRNLDGADCVLWFNLGITHVVRLEDWPVMPVERLEFHLKPWNFFTQNPTLDLPPTRNIASRNYDDAQRGGAGTSVAAAAASASEGAGACCAQAPTPNTPQPASKL